MRISKVLSALAIGVVLAAGSAVAVSAPAVAVPGCVSVQIDRSASDLFTSRTRGIAKNTCSSSQRGRWQYQEYSGGSGRSTYYSGCVTLSARFGQSYSEQKSLSNGTGIGSAVKGFVDC